MTQDTVYERTADDARIEAIANALADQRNSGLDVVATLRGELAAKDFEHARQVSNLQSQIEDLAGQLEKSRAREPLDGDASNASPQPPA